MILTEKGREFIACCLCTNCYLQLGTSDNPTNRLSTTNGYAPVPIRWNATAVENACCMTYDDSTKKLTNTNTFYFPDADGGDWGTVSHIFITSDSSTSGDNVLYIGALDTPVRIQNKTRPKFEAGALSITFTFNDGSN